MRRHHRTTYYRRVKRKVNEDLAQIDDNLGYEGDSSSCDEVSIGEVRVSVLSSSPPVPVVETCPPLETTEVMYNVTRDLFDNPSDAELSWGLSDFSMSHSSDSVTISALLDSESPELSSSPVPLPLSSKPAFDISEQLRKWAVGNNISNLAVTKLLHILQPKEPTLPKDARTLLNIKPVTEIVQMGLGQCFNFGLRNMLIPVINYDPSLTSLLLTFNIDGLPLFKSTKYECWPILCLVDGMGLPPFMSAVWCGPGKPPLHGYFKDLVPELKILLKDGIVHKGKHYAVKLKAFISDAPALAFVKGIVSYTAYYGCGRCGQKGMYRGRMTFPAMSDELRTDETFRFETQPDHHNNASPLLELDAELGLDMIQSFPLDYLHLICLGVVKRLLLWLLIGCKGVRRKQISEENLRIINGRLRVAGSFWPREFSRKPRSLDDIKRWKPVEFRQFVLYLVTVVFRGNVLSKDYYNLFILFHIACSLLCLDDLNYESIDVARTILCKFVTESRRLLGIQFVSYNVHNRIHLPDCCKILESWIIFLLFLLKMNYMS
ncbi:hypothetical protein FOCC_FOCC014123 [Frankliniella occidentalis]|nr:hypothetical protein FOCC_FOCC014123 [Frankliniella occidentalis]